MALLELAETSGTPVDRPANPSPGGGEVSVIRSLQAEIDSYYVEMRGFARMDITEIFMYLAAFSARASEVRTYLSRQASRRIDAFRTKELDPFIDECDRQFRIWSRLQSVRQLEADMSGKAI